MAKPEQRLAKLRALLQDLHRCLALEFGFRLWDQSTVPADWPPQALAIAIADEGVVASLLRAPKVTTLANLWAAKRIDIVNGSIFDLVAKRPNVRTRDLRKQVSKLKALSMATAFAFAPRGGPWPLEKPDTSASASEGPERNKRNIAFHYDLSNAFYQLFLDAEMVYSCAYFHDWNDTLEAAQVQKLDMICRKLRLKPGDSLLDIGCGWGALICHAARNYGVTAHGLTLSERQAELAREKIARLGLSGQVTVELKDYSQLEGEQRFDKIASIGMFEHVGIKNFPAYFAAVRRLLKPGGLYLHHAITLPGKGEGPRRRRPEFEALTRYIFPGGELESIGRTTLAIEAGGFEVHDVEDWREHYQRTCRFWHDRLLKNYDAACAEIGEVTTRVWLAYLAGCALAFERGTSLIYQTLASRRAKAPSGLPPTRADLYR